MNITSFDELFDGESKGQSIFDVAPVLKFNGETPNYFEFVGNIFVVLTIVYRNEVWVGESKKTSDFFLKPNEAKKHPIGDGAKLVGYMLLFNATKKSYHILILKGATFKSWVDYKNSHGKTIFTFTVKKDKKGGISYAYPVFQPSDYKGTMEEITQAMEKRDLFKSIALGDLPGEEVDF